MRNIFKKHNPMLTNTVFLAVTIFIIPLLIGVVFAMISHMMAVQNQSQPVERQALAELPPLDKLTNASQMMQAHQTLRAAGADTLAIDLRLWAQRQQEPEELFRIAPPDATQNWDWSLSQDGLYALAVAQTTADKVVRTVGLYDLIAGEWAWTNALPWPHAAVTLYVFDKTSVVRYTSNQRFFAIEIDALGKLVSMDELPSGGAPATWDTAPAQYAAYPCLAVKHGVFFTQDAQNDHLLGWPCQPLPGWRTAGPRDGDSGFSGNGLIKLYARGNTISLHDALTQTTLQQIKDWQPPQSDTTVTAIQGSAQGETFTLQMQTRFPGERAQVVQRAWQLQLDTYSGKLTRDLTPPPSNPPATAAASARSNDGLWEASYADQHLVISNTSLPAGHAVKVALAPLGITQPPQLLEWLTGQRYLLLRESNRDWLLDFTLARNYGNLQQRLQEANTKVERATYKLNRAGDDNAQLALDDAGYGIEQEYDFFYDYDREMFEKVAPSYLFLRAEQCIANQAWGYAAAFMEAAGHLQRYDARAPRINPLWLARCQLLAGQPAKAQATCREALQEIAMRPQVYNYFTGEVRDPYNTDTNDLRMLRYHLQGLLFAQP